MDESKFYDAVYAEQMEARAADGETELRGGPFGPAGTSVLELSDGVVLEVDHADPARLVSLVVDGPLVQSRLALTLLGQERFDWACAQLEAQQAAKGPGRTARARVPGRPGPELQSQPRRAQLGGSLAGAIGEAVVAADLSSDPSTSPLVRLAAGLEFLARVRDGDLGDILGPASEQVARDMYDVGLAVAPDDLAALGPRAAKQLHRFTSMLNWARREFPSLELPLRRVLDLLGGAGARRGGEPEPDVVLESAALMLRALPGDAGGFVDDEWMQVDALAAAAPPTADFMDVEMPGTGQLVVRVARHHEGRWVRVLKAAGLVPLALVPLLPEGVLLEARAVVPSDLAVHDLVVEVVDPDAAVPGERPLALVRAAVEAGRAAARYERLERADDASAAWSECAALWTKAGDGRRADQAARRSKAKGRYARGRTASALVADELAGALD